MQQTNNSIHAVVQPIKGRLPSCIAAITRVALPVLLVATSSLSASAAEPGKTLNFYNWGEYITPEALTEFQKETGIAVKYDVFNSNETLEAKLLTGRTGYDVVVPSDYYLAREIQAGVFTELDRSKLPNWKNLDLQLVKALEAADPGNKHGVPYLYGTVLFGFNPEKVKEVLGDNAPLDSWDMIFKEENISKLSKCGVAIMDSPTEVLPVVLHYLGLPPNSTNPEDYEKAKALMLKIRPYVTYFHTSKYQTDIAEGNICIALANSGAFYAANAAAKRGGGVTVDMRLPKEGSPVFFDVMSIPKDAPNPEAAYQFLNFILRPEVIAGVSNMVGYPNPNAAANDLVNADLTSNPNLYPTEAARATLYTLIPLPPKIERLRNRIWNTIKSGT